MEIEKLKQINLPEFLSRHYGLEVAGGKARCPFHPPDQNKSFSIFQNGGDVWLWKCFHDGEASGSIIDFVIRKDGLSVAEAIQKIKELEGIEDRPAEARPTGRTIERTYDYKDEAGKLLFQKVRYTPKAFACRRPEGSGWNFSIKGIKTVPYRLDKIKDKKRVFLCEGEKDADLLASLDYPSTSAPFGASSWPPELNPYFRGKAVFICYDVGNEAKVQKIAGELWGFTKQITILTVPLEAREADISDFLAPLKDSEAQKAAVEELIFNGVRFELKQDQERGVFVGSLEEFMKADITPADPLVDPLVFRSGFSMVGGVKGSHKSFFVIQLGLRLAAGKSPFLNSRVIRPAKVLLIQQEISTSFMKDRLSKIQQAEPLETSGRFTPITTTGKQLKLLCIKDLDQIKKWLDLYQPELLILDPISSFYDFEENSSREMARVRDVLNRLKATFNVAVLVSHHFSSKRNPNDPDAPQETAGWFRGHTCLSDAADVLICLHRLPGQRNNPNLTRAYEDYNQVEISLRNGRWPEKFSIEFDEDSFLLRLSDVWHEFGRKVLPDQVCALINANDGEMRRTDVINSLARDGVGPMAVRRAIDQAIDQQLVEKVQLFGKGAPVLLKLKGAA